MGEPWFDAPNRFDAWSGAIVGGVGGSLVGILGGLAGWLLPRGRGRQFFPAAMAVVMGAGLATLAVGLFALAVGQPYGIWYPLVHAGTLFGVLMAVGLVVVRSVLRGLERRRMEAEDLKRS